MENGSNHWAPALTSEICCPTGLISGPILYTLGFQQGGGGSADTRAQSQVSLLLPHRAIHQLFTSRKSPGVVNGPTGGGHT